MAESHHVIHRKVMQSEDLFCVPRNWMSCQAFVYKKLFYNYLISEPKFFQYINTKIFLHSFNIHQISKNATAV